MSLASHQHVPGFCVTPNLALYLYRVTQFQPDKRHQPLREAKRGWISKRVIRSILFRLRTPIAFQACRNGELSPLASSLSLYLSLIQHIKNLPGVFDAQATEKGVGCLSGRTFYTLGRVSQSSPGATTPAMDAKNLILSVEAIPLPIPGTT